MTDNPTQAVIFDIDGCLADASRRVKNLYYKPSLWDRITNKVPKKNFDAFFEDMENDPPFEGLAAILRAVVNDPNLHPVIVTARPYKFKRLTKEWLRDKCGVEESSYEIHTRGYHKNGREDRRPDNQVKKDLLKKLRLKGYKVIFAFDDRKRIVDMYRNKGVQTAQMAGDFE